MSLILPTVFGRAVQTAPRWRTILFDDFTVTSDIAITSRLPNKSVFGTNWTELWRDAQILATNDYAEVDPSSAIGEAQYNALDVGEENMLRVTARVGLFDASDDQGCSVAVSLRENGSYEGWSLWLASDAYPDIGGYMILYQMTDLGATFTPRASVEIPGVVGNNEWHNIRLIAVNDTLIGVHFQTGSVISYTSNFHRGETQVGILGVDLDGAAWTPIPRWDNFRVEVLR